MADSINLLIYSTVVPEEDKTNGGQITGQLQGIKFDLKTYFKVPKYI